ncbi:hypothetical protein [Fodinibius salsisoli]|uniref:Uncharacterized protein n=1 Tax=Fodinibius salsisoli TaxID=2820877 RepID=A0ABT3PMI1_9BACT|nr:hypothetical protein [Fodinibius salsisoli]MCW9706978.1 hypothetical protein [Fodinibius salsisoli]
MNDLSRVILTGVSIFLFLILLPAVCLAQQVLLDTVYIFFDTSSTETCTVDVEGKGYQEVSKFRKEDIENYKIFDICSEEFVFVKNKASKDTLVLRKRSDIQFQDIGFLTEAYKNAKPKKFKHNIFDQIYIVEKISKDKYIRYSVGWVDESIG